MSESICIQKLYVYSYEIPLKTAVFIRGVSFPVKRGLLIKLEDSNGSVSWGEISVLPPTEEKMKECLQLMEKNHLCILGSSDYSSPQISPEIDFAIKSAMDSLLGPVCVPDKPLKVNALLAGDFKNITKSAKEKYQSGYSIFKMKIGEYSLTDSISLITTVREIVGNGAKLILDLNRRWNLTQTLDFVEKVIDKGISYIEDPVEDLKDLLTYLNISPIKAGLDEFLEMEDLPWEEIKKEFVKKVVLIIKPSMLFGTNIWQKILDDKFCMKVITSSWETGIGLRGILNLINKNNLSVAFIGLDTYSFFTYDIVKPMLRFSVPQVSLKILEEKMEVLEEHLTMLNSWSLKEQKFFRRL